MQELFFDPYEDVCRFQPVFPTEVSIIGEKS